MTEIIQWTDWLELIAIDEPSEKRATNFRMVATLIRQQQTRLAELEGEVTALSGMLEEANRHAQEGWGKAFKALHAKASEGQEPSAG